MFNDFARPAEMWDLCLEMLHFAGAGPGRRPDRRRGAGSGTPRRRSRGGGVRRGRRRRRRARRLRGGGVAGPQAFPSDAAFPVAHVALRLESLAAGLWRPERGEQQSENGGRLSEAVRKWAPSLDDALVAETVLRATRDSFEAAHAAYDRLLAAPHAMHRAHHDRRMQAHARHLQTPALRLRLLPSAARRAAAWEGSTAEREPEPARGFGAYGGGNRRARAALADVCAGYAGEARRLLQVPASEQGAAEALAAEFEALGRRLASA